MKGIRWIHIREEVQHSRKMACPLTGLIGIQQYHVSPLYKAECIHLRRGGLPHLFCGTPVSCHEASSSQASSTQPTRSRAPLPLQATPSNFIPTAPLPQGLQCTALASPCNRLWYCKSLARRSWSCSALPSRTKAEFSLSRFRTWSGLSCWHWPRRPLFADIACC